MMLFPVDSSLSVSGRKSIIQTNMTRRRREMCFVGAIAVLLLLLKVLHHQSMIQLLGASSADLTDVPTVFLQKAQETHARSGANNNRKESDKDCIFRNSTIYRKVFVYPTFGENDNGWKGDILSDFGKNMSQPWPWLDIDKELRREGREQYAAYSMTAQFSTELLVRDILTHPDSCLRTHNPEEADLFYIPYLPSIEFHAGKRGKPPSFRTSPYAQAILDAINGNYEAWEQLFGWTSKYWKRRKGADHILVFSEPLQGLTHPKNKRGNFHFVHTQRQLDPPIVISVELSTTFVDMYPTCAAKNILMPYPINDGRYYNGGLFRETQEALEKASLWNNVSSWNAALPAEVEIHRQQHDETTSRVLYDNLNSTALADPLFLSPRPFSHWLKAGIHGSCTTLRQSMNRDYKCTKSCKPLRKEMGTMYAHNMRMATFCPCPGGDTASAKRMFDAVLAGCIPIVLSYDFVWPLSTEIKGVTRDDLKLQPSDFSLRLDAQEFTETKYDPETCTAKNATDLGLEERLQQIPPSELLRLRQGLRKAADRYSYYQFRPAFPDNPVQAGILPNGGAAHALVAALGERARGEKWPACAEELAQRPADRPEPTTFVC